MLNVKNNRHLLIGFCLFYVAVNLLSLSLPFFWGDAIVQSSISAQWYYDHNFAHFFLPPENNPGHPPFFGMYLALWWKIFGQTLAVSHLAMLPFLVGIAWQFFHIARYFLNEKTLLFALLLFAFEPTILAQSTMVTPELPIIFLYLLAIRALLYQQISWQILALALVVLLNTRGAIIVAVVYLSECLFFVSQSFTAYRRNESIRPIIPSFIRLSAKYIPAGLAALGWLGLHYYMEGWLGFNREDMPWKNSFIRMEGIGILKNLGVFGWRLLDFGRVFLWLFVTYVVLRKWHFFDFKSPKLHQLLILTLSPILVFAPVMLPYIGTLQHRYLLPFFVMFVICVAYCVQIFSTNKPQGEIRVTRVVKVYFSLLLVGLLSGHFWVYPDKISQGWEASLAHLPYFSVRDKMTNYVVAQGIRPNDIATGSPNKYRRLDSDLVRNGTWKMQDIDEVKFDTIRYVIYSNVFNDFADSTYDAIHADWVRLAEFERMQVRMCLFENPTVR